MDGAFLQSDIRKLSKAVSYVESLEDERAYYTAADMLGENMMFVAHQVLQRCRISLNGCAYRDYMEEGEFKCDYGGFLPLLDDAQKAFFRICSIAAHRAYPSNDIAEAIYEMENIAQPKTMMSKNVWFRDLRQAVASINAGGGESAGDFTWGEYVVSLFDKHEMSRLG
jgi:hypothetical protein